MRRNNCLLIRKLTYLLIKFLQSELIRKTRNGLPSFTPPPPFPERCCSAHAQKAEQFRPLPPALGHFRLFVLLIVDLTRLQPNIQRTARLSNRSVHRLVVRVPRCSAAAARAGLLRRRRVPRSRSVFACLFPLGAPGHAAGLCLCGGVWRRRALQFLTGV